MEHPPPPSALPPPPPRWRTGKRRRKLLVLDANGFLFWRLHKSKGRLHELPCAPDATAGDFHIFKRPHLSEFISWCSERFHVVVWSTAKGVNLHPMVQLAFHGLPPPVAVFDQTDCTDTCQAHPSKPHNLFLKELTRLWSDPRVVRLLHFERQVVQYLIQASGIFAEGALFLVVRS